MNCPYCYSTRLRKSASGTEALWPPLKYVVVCLRCYSCERRFHRPHGWASVPGEFPAKATAASPGPAGRKPR